MVTELGRLSLAVVEDFISYSVRGRRISACKRCDQLLVFIWFVLLYENLTYSLDELVPKPQHKH